MASKVGRNLGQGRALYIETEYFGGMGTQSAALFDNGSLVWTATHSTFQPEQRRSLLARIIKPSTQPPKSPISQGLEKLGVTQGDEKDEFDMLGLGRYRNLESLGFDYE